MRNRKVLVVIALVLLALFQAEVASACNMDAIVARVVLLEFGRLALIHVYNLNALPGRADVFFETRNYFIIALALIAMRSYLPTIISSNAASCPSSGSAETATYAEVRATF